MTVPRMRKAAMPHPARIAVTVYFMISGALLAAWVVRIPDIKAQLQLSDGQLGSALLSIPAGAFLGQILTGWLLPSWGSRSLSILLTLLSCVIFPLLGTANNLLLLMLTLALFGVIFGGMDVAMNAQGALVERTNGQPIMSSLHGMWSVAGLISASIGGYLAGQSTSILWHFTAMALVSCVAAIAAYRNTVADPKQLSREGHAFALPPLGLLPLGVIAFSVMLCEGAIGDWSAVYLRESLGSAPAIAAIGYIVFSLLMTVGRLTGDWLIVRLGAARIVRAGGLLVIVGIGLALLSQVPIIAIIGFGLIGAGIACPFPIILSTASRRPGVDPGRAIAAMATVAYTGSLLGPPLIGSAAELLTLRGALAILALAGAIMVALGGVVRPQPAS